MTNEKGSGVLGALVTLAGSGVLGVLATLTVLSVPIFRIGGIDAPRTAYNFVYGDAPQLKERLVEYCEAGIKRENPTFTEMQVENTLKRKLEYPHKGPIDPARAGIEELWDASEDYAPNVLERWVWPKLR